MKNKRVIFSSTVNRKILNLLDVADNKFICFFLDEDKRDSIEILKHRQIEKVITSLPVPDTGSRERFCREYIDLVGRVGRAYNSIYWWVTFVSSKNRFASALANRLFSLTYILKIAKVSERDILIICGDKELMTALKLAFKEENIDVISDTDTFKELYTKVLFYLKCIKSVVIFTLRAYKKIILCNFYFGKCLNQHLKNNNLYVIRSFVYRDISSLVNGLRDAFFGILPQYVAKENNLLMLVEILKDYRQNLKKIKQSNLAVIPVEYLLSPSDIISVITGLFVNRIRVKHIFFHNIDVSFLLNSEIDRDYIKGSCFSQYLHYRAIRNLVRMSENIDVFVYTYENNPWERMSVLAFRKYSPDTYIIGYQHSVVPQASANIFVSEYEKDIIPLPDRIVTSGKIPKDLMQRYGSINSKKIVEGCGFRIQTARSIVLKDRISSKKILVILEGVIEVYKLINYVYHQMRDCLDYEVKFRTHPILPWRRIEPKLDFNIKSVSHFSVSNKRSLASDINEADIIIYWGSTAALEGVMAGKPVIHYDRGDALNYDPLFDCGFFKWTVNNQDNLSDVIKSIYALPEDKFYHLQKKAIEYLNDYFSNITEEGISKFLRKETI